MTQEIDLGGTIYISSKLAAEKTGYTQDYIGQLARASSIDAKRISGLWYVQEDSLRNYKAKADEFVPTPPQKKEPTVDLESAVSFDGKDYVSAQRAAKITGYAQDYVGQLARSGKIVSRQIGNRWYVDREAIVAHKKHNDALLAAVQAESVGLDRNLPVTPVMQELKKEDDEVFFNYTPETLAPIPTLEESELPSSEAETVQDEPEIPAETADEVNAIPIRVIKPVTATKATRRDQVALPVLQKRISAMTIFLGIFSLIFILGVSGLFLTGRFGIPGALSSKIAGNGILGQSTGSEEETGDWELVDMLRSIASKELYYRRTMDF